MEEIWKRIEDYPNYEVSNMGRVKSFTKNKNGVILKGCKHKYGYTFISLVNESGKQTYLLHRLVAFAFIPNPENKPHIDHINGDPTDNKVENLRWCTQKENINNPICINKQIESHKGKCSMESSNHKAVKQLDLNGTTIRIWGCAVDAAHEIGIPKQSISACIKGKYNTAGGYKWIYA